MRSQKKELVQVLIKLKLFKTGPDQKHLSKWGGLSWSLVLLQEILDDVSKLYKVSVIMHLHCYVAYLEMIIKVCSHSSFHWNIEPFSHSLCNGLAMIAKFVHIFPVIGPKTKKAPLICLGVFGLGQSWTVLTLSGPVLIPSSETTCSKKT
jgi:hypothetical protein